MNEVSTQIIRPRAEIKLTSAQEARFWAKVNKDGPTMDHMETPCWLWTACKTREYGAFRVGGKMIKSHRIAWTLANSPIPNDGSFHGICVCHRCDNRLCVNPSHLFLGTTADNVRDKLSKGRQSRGDKHGSAKLANAQIVEIRTIYASGGVALSMIGSQFGVHRSLIGYIIRRKAWKHV